MKILSATDGVKVIDASVRVVYCSLPNFKTTRLFVCAPLPTFAVEQLCKSLLHKLSFFCCELTGFSLMLTFFIKFRYQSPHL